MYPGPTFLGRPALGCKSPFSVMLSDSWFSASSSNRLRGCSGSGSISRSGSAVSYTHLGDLADLKVKSCDIEAWSPRQQKYFEGKIMADSKEYGIRRFYSCQNSASSSFIFSQFTTSNGYHSLGNKS